MPKTWNSTKTKLHVWSSCMWLYQVGKENIPLHTHQYLKTRRHAYNHLSKFWKSSKNIIYDNNSMEFHNNLSVCCFIERHKDLAKMFLSSNCEKSSVELQLTVAFGTFFYVRFNNKSIKFYYTTVHTDGANNQLHVSKRERLLQVIFQQKEAVLTAWNNRHTINAHCGAVHYTYIIYIYYIII